MKDGLDSGRLKDSQENKGRPVLGNYFSSDYVTIRKSKKQKERISLNE